MSGIDERVLFECTTNNLISGFSLEVTVSDQNETTLREKVLVPCEVIHDIILWMFDINNCYHNYNITGYA